MRTVVFATTSRWKLSQAQHFLEPFGIQVEYPPQFSLPPDQLFVASAGGSDQYTIEIQAETMQEVCAFKAQMAAKNLQVPVIVEDIGVKIDAFHGFPGPYTKYAVVKLGVDGFERLLLGEPERRAVMESVVGFCEPKSSPHLFSGAMHGSLVDSARVDQSNPWKDVLLYPLFVPEGESRTLAEILPDELQDIGNFPSKQSFEAFARWYSPADGSGAA
jgi:XTP/dITP diphosphohydrolase